MLEAKAKDQGHKAQVLSKKKKKKGLHKNFSGDLQKKKKKKKKKRSSQKFFKRSPRKNAFQKIFQPLHKILTFQKIVLSSSRGQANFRGLEASRPRPRTWPSRPRPRPRTSKSVLEDSTSVHYKTKLSNQVCKIKAKKQLFFKLNKEYFILSKLILAKITLQLFLNHKTQQNWNIQLLIGALS